MIFVANHNGQIGNRIVLFLHSLATAIDTKQSLLFLFGSDVRRACALPKGESGFRVGCPGFSAVRLWRFGLFVLQKGFGYAPFSSRNRRQYLMSLPDRLKRIAARPGRIHPVFFWDFKNNAALVRHRDEILRTVRIHPRHFRKPDAFLSTLRDKADTIVGVHVRRGDYRSFHGGKFMFDLADWAQFMNSFLDGESGTKTVFVVVSDETVPIGELRSSGFRGEALQMPGGTPFEDMALLSRCDFVMGVPSTFSWCAAFLGNRPLLVLRNRETVCGRSRFRPVSGDEYRVQAWGMDSFIEQRKEPAE